MKEHANSTVYVKESTIGDYMEQKFESKVDKEKNNLEISDLQLFTQRGLNLLNLMRADLKNDEHLDYIIREINNNKNKLKPYKCFVPLKRIKGTIKKVHKLGLNSYPRFIYVNPVDGVLISYHN